MSSQGLTVENLTVAFPAMGFTAVDKVSFHLPRKSVLGIMGESGCGKTLLARALFGLEPPGARVDGSLIIDGIDLRNCPEKQKLTMYGRQLAYVPQNSATALHPMRRCGKSLLFALRKKEKSGSSKPSYVRCLNALRKAGFADPEAVARLYPNQLSGGMRQRVLNALALLLNPHYLIMDEPTKGLDAPLRKVMGEWIRNTALNSDTGVLLISHDLELIRRACDSVILMRDGQVESQGMRHEIFGEAASGYGYTFTRGMDEILSRDPLAADSYAASNRNSRSLLTATGVEKTYATGVFSLRRFQAVKPTTIRVFAGERVGIVGASGSGKTTLARILLGLEKPDSGNVTATHRGVAGLFQHPEAAFNPRMKLGESLLLPLRWKGVSKLEGQNGLGRWLERMRLDDSHLHHYPHQLSGGQLQRLALVRALLIRPAVLVLDEPTSMLDPIASAAVIEGLDAFMDQPETALVLISHDHHLVDSLADRIIFMRDGVAVTRGFEMRRGSADYRVHE